MEHLYIYTTNNDYIEYILYVNSFLLFFLHIWCERANEHNIHDIVYLYQHIL